MTFSDWVMTVAAWIGLTVIVYFTQRLKRWLLRKAGMKNV